MARLLWTAFLSTVLLGSSMVMLSNGATPPIEIQNYKFFESESGKSVAFKGIAYYPRSNDGIYDANSIDFFTEEHRLLWERDIPHLKSLGVNAIRIYAVDPSKNHDAFMCALQEAGIYVIVGLAASCEGCSIEGSVPPESSTESGCYSSVLKNRGQFVIRTFSRYDNVIGFSAGNESHLWNEVDDLLNAPCQKKFMRDMRVYIASCSSKEGLRQIPVGNIVADTNRDLFARYYNCQGDANDPFESAEWYGINAYQSCDGTVTDIGNAPGFQQLKASFENYSIPLLLTEFGCLNPSFPTIDGYEAQRSFSQAQALFEPDFRDVFAGGFVFEYSTERSNSIAELSTTKSEYPFTSYGRNNFGVGYFSPELCNDVDVPCMYKKFPNYANLQSVYANADAVGVVNKDSFVPEDNRVGLSTCPNEIRPISDFTWNVVDETPDKTCANAASWTCPNMVTPTKSPLAEGPTSAPSSPMPTSWRPPAEWDTSDGFKFKNNITLAYVVALIAAICSA